MSLGDLHAEHDELVEEVWQSGALDDLVRRRVWDAPNDLTPMPQPSRGWQML